MASLIPVLLWVSLLVLPSGFLLIGLEAWKGRSSPVFFRRFWRMFHLAIPVLTLAGLVAMTLAPAVLEECGLMPGRFPSETTPFWLWLAGASIVALGALFSLWRRARWEKESVPVDDETARQVTILCREFGLSAPPAIRLHPALNGPAVSGVRRPVLWLPENFRRESESLRRAALAHEIFHLRDRDLAWDLVQRFAFGLLFFHPLLWWSAFASYRASERAADRRAVESGVSSGDLARALIRFASASPFPGRAVSPGFHALRDRLLCLEQDEPRRGVASALAILVAVFSVAPVTMASMLAPSRHATPSLACAIQTQNDYVHELIRQGTPEKPYSER